jgi:hypothetical protein
MKNGVMEYWSSEKGSSRKSVGKLMSLMECIMASNKEKGAFKGVKKSV